MHAGRAAYYARVFTNLYRKSGNEPFYVHDLTKVMVEREKIAKSITKDPSYAHARLFGSVNDIIKTAKLEKQKYRVKFT